MTNRQKQVLAAAVISEVGGLIELWDEKVLYYYPELRDVSTEDAARVMSQWMKNLPGLAWSAFLPDPH